VNALDWIGAVAGLLGATVAVLTAISAAQKNEVQVLREIIEELQTWREEAKGQIAELEAEVEKWKRRYCELCIWVRQHGLEPPKRHTAPDLE